MIRFTILYDPTPQTISDMIPIFRTMLSAIVWNLLLNLLSKKKSSKKDFFKQTAEGGN